MFKNIFWFLRFRHHAYNSIHRFLECPHNQQYKRVYLAFWPILYRPRKALLFFCTHSRILRWYVHVQSLWPSIPMGSLVCHFLLARNFLVLLPHGFLHPGSNIQHYRISYKKNVSSVVSFVRNV